VKKPLSAWINKRGRRDMRNLLVSSSYAPLKPGATSFVMGAEAGRIRKEKIK
jgi:hypothetical protein